MNRFVLRIKILIKDRTACICYVVSAIVMLCLLAGLSSSSEERSAVPIGLIVDDDSPEAESLRQHIKENSAVYVIEGRYDDLQAQLLDGYINSIFIIEKGYGERLKISDIEGLITIISGEDDRMSVVIGDILAGSMMYDICVNKSYRAYKALDGEKKLTREEYIDYIMQNKNDASFAFDFGITYKTAGSAKIEETEITNGMIYKQMIAGMLAMLMCLMAFVSCNCFCLEYENGVAKRLKELPGSRIPSETMDFFGIFVYTLPLSIISGILMSGIKSILVSMVYLFVMSVVCTLISKSVKKTESYQLVGAVLVIGVGILGFVSVFSGIIGGPEFLKYTPNAIFINMLL